MALVLVLLVLLAGGTAAGVAVTVLDFNPLEPAQGSVDDSALVVEDESISYNGFEADTLTFTLNNTDGVAHTANVNVRLVDTNGATVVTDATTGVSVPADGSTSQTVNLGGQNVTTFETVEVLVEETS